MSDVAKCGPAVTLDTKTCFDVKAGIGLASARAIFFILSKPVEGNLWFPCELRGP